MKIHTAIISIFAALGFGIFLSGCATISKTEFAKFEPKKISEIKGVKLSFHYRWENGDSPACFTKGEAEAIEKAFLEMGLRHDPSSAQELEVVLTNVTERRYISAPINAVLTYYSYFIVPIYLAQEFDIVVTHKNGSQVLKVEKGTFDYEALMSPFISYKLFTESFRTQLAESKAEALVSVSRKVVSIDTLPTGIGSVQQKVVFDQSLVLCSGWQTRTY